MDCPQVISRQAHTGGAACRAPGGKTGPARRPPACVPEGVNGVGRKMVTGDTGLRFALLGRLRAWRGDRELELGSPQQQAFLAVLLLRQERAASVADVVEALWGGNPPPRAVGALRTYASRLRKLLEP